MLREEERMCDRNKDGKARRADKMKKVRENSGESLSARAKKSARAQPLECF